MTEPMFPRPIAHRGLHDRAKGVIENSASAFEAAIAGNFAIECDVQLTSDGVAVVFHDDVLKRLHRQRRRPYVEISAAELVIMLARCRRSTIARESFNRFPCRYPWLLTPGD